MRKWNDFDLTTPQKYLDHAKANSANTGGIFIVLYLLINT